MRLGIQSIFVWMAVLACVAIAPRANGQKGDAAPLPEAAEPTTAPTGRAAIIVVDGMVHDFTRDSIRRRFTEARELGADTIILEINTYGGLVTSALEISGFLKRQDDIHVIAYVHEKAISAGAMIACAANEIVMGPSALIGDSAPIQAMPGAGAQEMGAAERAKAESPNLADFYDSAVTNGHNPLLLEGMVAVDRVIHWIENSDGERRLVNAEDYARLTADGAWSAVPNAPNPIDGPHSLVTMGTDLAVRVGLASGTSRSPETLAQERGLTIVGRLAPGTAESLIGLFSHPGLKFVLVIGLLGCLYLSLSSPGTGGAEAGAVVCLAALVGVPMLTGYAQWWELIAILIGFALIAVEIFVLPGFGVAGISGLVLVIGGLVMTFIPGGWPGSTPSFESVGDALQRGLIVVLGGLVSSLMLWIWLGRYLPKLPGFNRLLLQSPDGQPTEVETGTASPVTWPSVGAIGRAVTDLRPGGAAAFTDESINDTRVADVVSDSGFVRANTPVIVREVHGNRVVVRVTT